MGHMMVIYNCPTFEFAELDVALDVVISECEAREAQSGPGECVTIYKHPHGV